MKKYLLVQLKQLREGDRFFLVSVQRTPEGREVFPTPLVYKSKVGNKVMTYFENAPDVGGWMSTSQLVIHLKEC